jgi:protein transport protein SEC61 subunit gamma-like protein
LSRNVPSQTRKVSFINVLSLLSVQYTNKPCPEYLKIIRAVGIGFVMMGFVGYAIKLVHIPIRYLIV